MLAHVRSGLEFSWVDTALGPMLVAATSLGIAALSRTDDTPAFLSRLARRFPGAPPSPQGPHASEAERWLRRYLVGESRERPEIDLTGIGAWDARVYRAVWEIPYGETATYGELARAIGSPGAARAVGGAMSRCPLFPAVPCHRVVKAGDGFSGWGGGDIAVKRRLLDLEGG